ncbi:hypothetical protein [Streptomyces avidinii]
MDRLERGGAARATFSVALTFCEDCTMVGVDIRNRGMAAPDGTQTALPTGMAPASRSRIARCTRRWMPGSEAA